MQESKGRAEEDEEEGGKGDETEMMSLAWYI